MYSKTEKPQLLCFSNCLVIGSHYVTLLSLEFMSRKIHVPAQHADNERFWNGGDHIVGKIDSVF